MKSKKDFTLTIVVKSPSGFISFTGRYLEGYYAPEGGSDYVIAPIHNRLVRFSITRDELIHGSQDIDTFWELCQAVGRADWERGLMDEMGYPEHVSRDDLELLRRGVPIDVGMGEVLIDGHRHYHHWMAWPTGPIAPAGDGEIELLCYRSRFSLYPCRACEDSPIMSPWGGLGNLEGIQYKALQGEDVTELLPLLRRPGIKLTAKGNPLALP